MADPFASPPADWLAAIRTFMEEQIPFNRVLGVRCVLLEPGHAVLRMPFREELIGNPFAHALHGGTLSALADAAGGAAVFSAAEPGSVVSTIDLRIDYLRPGAALDTQAEAEVTRIGGRVAVARIRLTQRADGGNESSEVRVHEADRRVIAESTGVYAVRRARLD